MPNRFPFNTPNHPEDNRSINKAFDRNYGNRLKSGDTTTLKYTIKDGDGEPLDKERFPNMQTSLILKYEGVTAYKTEFEATLEEVTENYVGDLVARFRIDEALPPSDTPYVVEFHFEDDEDLFIFPSVNTLELYITPSALNSDEEAIKSISDQRLNEIIERKLEENPVLSEAEANELARQENYQELLDTGVMQTKINERLEDLEEEYAPKLTEVTAQLAQKANKDTFEDYRDATGFSLAAIVQQFGLNPIPEPIYIENLWKKVSKTDELLSETSGSVYPNSNNKTTDFIEVLPNNEYTLSSVPLAGPVNYVLCYYDENNTFVQGEDGRFNDTVGWQETIVTPSNIKYLRLSVANIAENTFVFNVGNEPLSEETEDELWDGNFWGNVPSPPLKKESVNNGHLKNGIISKDKLSQELLSMINTGSRLNPYPPRPKFESVYTGWAEPRWLSQDGEVLWGGQGTALFQSKDEWATREQIGNRLPTEVYAIIGVRELSNGELLVSTNRTNDVTNSKVFKIQNYDRDNPSAATYKEVLTVEASRANVSNNWGFSIYDEIVLVSEYGLRGDDGARRVYLSTDYGDTFTVIFDQKTVVADGKPTWTSTAHIHGGVYDPYWNRIWVVCGDNPNTATYFSDDMGETWTFVTGSEEMQYTGIMPLEDSVVFGSDRAPNGLHVYHRGDKSEMPVIEPMFLINDSPQISHIFELVYKQDYSKNRESYFTATSAIPNGTSLVVGFVDGRKGHLIHETEPVYEEGRGIRCALGPTVQGNLIIQKADQSVTGFNVMKAPAPIWM